MEPVEATRESVFNVKLPAFLFWGRPKVIASVELQEFDAVDFPCKPLQEFEIHPMGGCRRMVSESPLRNPLFNDDSNDELLSRFAPFFKKRIEDALEPILGPVVSVLQSHGEAERKQRETFLALEEKKLALRSEKIQLQRRRGGRACQLRRSASSVKSSRLKIRQGLRLESLSQ